MSEPCFYCGAARSCKHRTVEAPKTLKTPPPDKRPKGSTYSIGGLHRKRDAHLNSLFGKAGNPTKEQFEELTKNLFKKIGK
jgi:hypothetical protein